MAKILIQANNLDTVVDVFMYIYLHPDCKKQDIADYCDFSLRQVDYYTNACKYLDLINNDWSPTELATDIFTNSPAEITERIYQRIIDDNMIGEIYSWIAADSQQDYSDRAKELIRENYPGYSEAVYNRRSGTIIKWCNKISNYMNNK